LFGCASLICAASHVWHSSFLNATPEFQAIVVAISSPLPLTVRVPCDARRRLRVHASNSLLFCWPLQVSVLFMINPTERRLLRGAAGAPPQLAAESGAELLRQKMNIDLPHEDLEQAA